MWLETVIGPRLAWRDGRVVEPFEPFEILRARSGEGRPAPDARGRLTLPIRPEVMEAPRHGHPQEEGT